MLASVFKSPVNKLQIQRYNELTSKNVRELQQNVGTLDKNNGESVDKYNGDDRSP